MPLNRSGANQLKQLRKRLNRQRGLQGKLNHREHLLKTCSNQRELHRHKLRPDRLHHKRKHQWTSNLCAIALRETLLIIVPVLQLSKGRHPPSNQCVRHHSSNLPVRQRRNSSPVWSNQDKLLSSSLCARLHLSNSRGRNSQDSNLCARLRLSSRRHLSSSLCVRQNHHSSPEMSR